MDTRLATSSNKVDSFLSLDLLKIHIARLNAMYNDLICLGYSGQFTALQFTHIINRDSRLDCAIETAISAAKTRKLVRLVVRRVLKLRLEIMQSPVSFRSTEANESEVRSGVGSSTEVSISKSFKEVAVLLLGRRDRDVCEAIRSERRPFWWGECKYAASR